MADKPVAEGKVLVDLGGGVYAEKVVAVTSTGADISGGGGGGGAVTVADGADVTQGATTDAAVAAGAAGTESAKLRRLTTDLATRLSESDFDAKVGALTEAAPASDTASSGLNGRLQRVAQNLSSSITLLTALAAQLPASLGIKTAAASLSVAPASDAIFGMRGTDLTATGTLSSASGAGSTVAINTNGLATVSADVGSPMVGTVTYEVTFDDTNWVVIQALQVVQNGAWGTTDTTFPARRLFDVGGASQFRVRCSAYTSGTPTVTLRGSVVPHVVRIGPGMTTEVTGADAFSNSLSYIVNTNGGSRLLGIAQHVYNNGSWDRVRNNIAVTLLTSGARTTTQTGADIVTYNARTVKVILDMTNVGSSPSVTVAIQGKTASGIYYPLLTGAAIVAVSTNVYDVGAGIPNVANVSAGVALPKTIRIVVTANNANSGTYSVDYELGN